MKINKPKRLVFIRVLGGMLMICRDIGRNLCSNKKTKRGVSLLEIRPQKDCTHYLYTQKRTVNITLTKNILKYSILGHILM